MGDYSLSEMTAILLKAARGAGLSWGLAQDAAHAAVWLERRGLPGLEVYARWAETRNGTERSRHCPITLGAYFADRGGQALEAGPVRHAPLDAPLLIVPFAARAGTLIGAPVSVVWPGAELICANDHVLIVSGDRLGAACADELTLVRAETARVPGPDLADRCEIPENLLRRLDRLVRETYVPESEASRLRGAGGAED